MILVKDRSFYKLFFSMSIILILQNVVTLGVNLADNVMLGAYSEAALSGVTCVNQIQFIYQTLLTGAGEGLVILGSQYFGKNQLNPVRNLSAIAMRFSLLIAIVLFALVSLFPHALLSAFTTDEQIITQGMEYMVIIRWTYLFFAVSQLILAILRSIGIVRIAFIMSVFALITNCSLNYIFIFGHLGFPAMGSAGAAIATLIARIAECLILILYLIKNSSSLKMKPADFLRKDSVLQKDYFRVTTPILIANGLWGLNTTVQTIILGHMTARAIAANSAASSLYMVVKSMALGTGSAAAFISGKTVGEGDMKKLKAYSRTMQLLFVFIGLLAGVILYFLRIPVLSVYRLQPETLKMADTFLKILSVIVIGMTYQMPVNSGIIRGGGNTRYPLLLDLISIWGIVIPVSIFMAFVVHASPIIVLCCLNMDQLFKCIPAFLKVNYGKWAVRRTR